MAAEKTTRKKTRTKTATKMNVLDAAARVLGESGAPMDLNVNDQSDGHERLLNECGWPNTPRIALCRNHPRDQTNGLRGRFQKTERGKFALVVSKPAKAENTSVTQFVAMLRGPVRQRLVAMWAVRNLRQHLIGSAGGFGGTSIWSD